MCGILGILDYGNISTYDIDRLSKIQHHRGPDYCGVYKSNDVLLIHNRLSILDLSSNGNQPLLSKSGRFIILYNGEVYNFQELANEIRSFKNDLSLQFNSSSDTEIILEAFEIWGISFIEKLNGMFAIAIYDKEKEELYLIRDRIGIKPLYYSFQNNSFIFSSELKGITNSSKTKFSVNNNSIKLYLELGYVPSPFTIYNEIYKLAPGEFLRYSKDSLERKTYWKITDQIKTEQISNENEALIKTSDILKSSVQYQLISDVPVGIFLSGGIDSSLVTALACNTSSIKPNTFTIGFEENSFDESKYAKNVASFLRTNHNEYILSYKNAIDYIDMFLESYDEPFSDSSGIPSLIVSKLANSKVKVVLSGEGGDELFLGYGVYNWLNRLNNPLFNTSHKIIKTLLYNFPSNRTKKAARYFDFNKCDNLSLHAFSCEQNIFTEKEINSVIKSEKINNRLLKSLIQQIDSYNLSYEEKQSLFDLAHYLPGDLLTKMDRATMKNSIEGRVPFLDHRLVELAYQISPSIKLKNGDKKYLLKNILYQYIPKAYFERPKQGFSIPLKSWLKNELKEKVISELNTSNLEEFGIPKKMTQNLLNGFYIQNNEMLYNKVWLLFVLNSWHIRNKKFTQ